MKEEKFLIAVCSFRFSDTKNKGYDSTSKNKSHWRVILERFDATDSSQGDLKALPGC